MESGAMHFKMIRDICSKLRETQMHGHGRMRWNHLCIEGAIADLLVRLFEVPDHSRNVSILSGQHRLRIVCCKAVSVKRMQILVREIGWLANSLRVQQSESALKGSSRRSRFLEQVCVRPVA